MELIDRPSGKETDEDLLKQQEIFFKDKKHSSVKIKTLSSHNDLQFDMHENAKTEEKIDEVLDSEMKDLIFDVKERDVSYEPFVFIPPVCKTGEIKRVSEKPMKGIQFAAKRKSKTIFTQLLEQKEPIHSNGANVLMPPTQSSLVDCSGLTVESKETELKKIHEDNIAKLSSMTEEEILHHQKQLKNHLDPTIVRFIQSRSNRKCFPLESEAPLSKSRESKLIYNTIKQPTDEVIRKEGRDDCDALILQKSMEAELSVDTKTSNFNSSNKTIEVPEQTKLMIKSVSKGKWRNMSTIEKEKLEWMLELPKAIPVNMKTGVTARFDFEGNLLANDVDTATYKGLHHHGKEPEVAGYSLEELFLLARSTLQSQRITALHIIAHILENYWYGLFDSCFDSPLLPMMLESGIVPLLRWALDDVSLTSVSATVTAIHSLLICKSDEICLQRTYCWPNGHVVPQIEPQGLSDHEFVLEELTDADLIKLDVIKAFLRMDVLPRFVYLLQSLQPPPLVCKLIIEICTHLAQHSTESANWVARQHGLLKLIFEKFLPLSWQFVDGSKLTDTVNYRCPTSSAMKLVRIIISSNKHLALHLVNHFDLIPCITLYLTLCPNDGKVSIQDIQLLMIETLKTFHVLLCYGIALNLFLELFPLFLRQMDFCLSLDLSMERTKHLQDFEYASHLFKTLEAVAAISIGEGHFSDSLDVALKTIFRKSLTCLKKWLWQFSKETPSDHAVMLLTACMNFVSTFYKTSHRGLVCETWEYCSETKDIVNAYLLPCLKSKAFKILLENLVSCSLLLNSHKSGNTRDSKTIVSLGSILWKGDIVPLLKETSPFPLLLAILKFSVLQKQHFNDVNNKALLDFLGNNRIIEYINRISNEKLNACNWFSRYESHCISTMIQLASLLIPEDILFWYKAGASLVLTLKKPDECIVEDIFESMLFNKSFLICTRNENFETLSKLPVIVKCYTTSLLGEECISHSRKLFYGSTDLTSVSVLSNPPFLLSKDWCYFLIIKKYQSFTNRELIPIMPDENLLLLSSLEWIHLCHELKLPLLNNIPAAVEFSYLCLVFLFDEDFFRLPNVQTLLDKNVHPLLTIKSMHLSKLKWNNLNGFDNIYLEMLNHFEAVSYGDQLFGNFIVLPLQQTYPSRWRKLLLSEHSQVLRFLRVPFSKLLVPVQNYLEPIESDIDIISEYHKLLVSGALNHIHCPLVYLMAVHHINSFLFTRGDDLQNSQKFLLSSILISKRKDLCKQILLYSETNLESIYGFNMKQELSAADKEYLCNIAGKSIIDL